MPHAQHRDVHAGERVLAQLVLHGRLDAAPDTERRERRRIARAAVRRIDAGDVLGHRADDLHVLEAGAAVLGGDVVAAQIFEEFPERAKERHAVEGVLGAHDDALAATVREARQGGLVGHPAREAERVDEGVLVGRVRNEAAPAERRTQARVVDGHDGLQPGALVELEVNFAVVVGREVAEELHALRDSSPQGAKPACSCSPSSVRDPTPRRRRSADGGSPGHREGPWPRPRHGSPHERASWGHRAMDIAGVTGARKNWICRKSCPISRRRPSARPARSPGRPRLSRPPRDLTFGPETRDERAARRAHSPLAS